LQPRDVSPDDCCYDKLTELNQMKEYVEKKLHSAPYSKSSYIFFCTKIITKWQEPYRIVQKLGPLNYEIVLGTLNKT